MGNDKEGKQPFSGVHRTVRLLNHLPVIASEGRNARIMRWQDFIAHIQAQPCIIYCFPYLYRILRTQHMVNIEHHLRGARTAPFIATSALLLTVSPWVHVLAQTPADTGKVYFGAWVELEDESGETSRFRIVGPDELDLRQGHISIDSPLARALLGKMLDAEVRVQTPEGEKLFYLTQIKYL